MLKTLRALLDLPPEERWACARRALEPGHPPPDLRADPGPSLAAVQQSPGTPERVVIALDAAGPWLNLACLHTALVNGTLLTLSREELPSALQTLDKARSRTIVASPLTFDNHTLALLNRVHEGPGRQSTQIGLMTARDPASLLRLIHRSAVLRKTGIPRDVLLATHAEELHELPDPAPAGAAVLNREETLPDRIRGGLGDQVGVLSLLAHGRDDILWFKSSLICGRARDTEFDGSFGGLPSCAHTGVCYQPRRLLLDPATLPAPVVFINSCAALKLSHSVFPMRYNVGLRFLDGHACALVASPLMTNGNLWQNLLFQFLLQSGRSLGETVRILNEATARSGLDFPGLHLVGDPELSMATDEAPAPIWWLGRDPASPQRIDTGLRHFVEIALPATYHEVPFTVTAEEKLPTKRTIYYAAARAGDTVRLFLFSLWPLPPALTLTLHPGDVLTELRREYAQSQEILQTAELMGIRDQNLDRLGPELRQSLRSVQSVAESQRYSLQDAATGLRRSRYVCSLKDRITETLLDWLLLHSTQHNLQLYETYRRAYSAGGWSWGPALCSACGEPVIRFHTRSNLAAARERKVELCPTCGIVHDSSCGLRLAVTGNRQLPVGQAAPLTLVVTNKDSVHHSGRVGVAVVNGYYYGISVEPDRFEVQLPPGASVSFPIVVRTTETPMHHFWIRAFLLSDGHLVSAGDNLWVTPAEAGVIHSASFSGSSNG